MHLLSAKPAFQITGRESTRPYGFVIGFDDLMVMPTEFQVVLDVFIANFTEVFVFIDDILLVTKGTEQEPRTKVQEISDVIDHAELQK